jgi:hypothetical protein
MTSSLDILLEESDDGIKIDAEACNLLNDYR